MDAPPLNTKPTEKQFEDHFTLHYTSGTVTNFSDMMDLVPALGEHHISNTGFTLTTNPDAMVLDDTIKTTSITDPGVRFISEKFASIQSRSTVSSECVEWMTQFIKKSLKAIYDHINKSPLHFYLRDIRNFQMWVEKKAVDAYAFEYISIPNKENSHFDTFKFVYEYKPADTLNVHNRFSIFVYNLISLWNLNIWIKSNGDPNHFYNIVSATIQNIDSLDGECPSFFKFYNSLLLRTTNRDGCKIEDIDYEICRSYIDSVNDQIMSVVHKILISCKSYPWYMQFMGFIGNCIKFTKKAVDFSYYREKDRMICTFEMIKNENSLETATHKQVFSDWRWSNYDMLAVIFLIYKTKLYVKVFAPYREIDPSKDLYENFIDVLQITLGLSTEELERIAPSNIRGKSH